MLEPRVDLKRFEEKYVVPFEQQPIETGKVLFYGSSGFTRWGTRWDNRPLEEDIPGCINHGFGGSTAEELLYYYHRLVKPWAPRALLVSIFHNDRGFGYSPEEVMINLAKLLEDAGSNDPEKLRQDIFVEDQIHFNQLGYDIYKEFMKERLKEIL